MSLKETLLLRTQVSMKSHGRDAHRSGRAIDTALGWLEDRADMGLYWATLQAIDYGEDNLESIKDFLEVRGLVTRWTDKKDLRVSWGEPKKEPQQSFKQDLLTRMQRAVPDKVKQGIMDAFREKADQGLHQTTISITRVDPGPDLTEAIHEWLRSEGLQVDLCTHPQDGPYSRVTWAGGSVEPQNEDIWQAKRPHSMGYVPE